MNQQIKNAVDRYVHLLPDLYLSPNDDCRLVRIAYEIEIVDANFDEEFEDYFIGKLSNRFNEHEKDFIACFYQKCKEKISDYTYVIGHLKTMKLLK